MDVSVDADDTNYFPDSAALDMVCRLVSLCLSGVCLTRFVVRQMHGFLISALAMATRRSIRYELISTLSHDLLCGCCRCCCCCCCLFSNHLGFCCSWSFPRTRGRDGRELALETIPKDREVCNCEICNWNSTEFPLVFSQIPTPTSMNPMTAEFVNRFHSYVQGVDGPDLLPVVLLTRVWVCVVICAEIWLVGTWLASQTRPTHLPWTWSSAACLSTLHPVAPLMLANGGSRIAWTNMYFTGCPNALRVSFLPGNNPTPSPLRPCPLWCMHFRTFPS